MLVTYIPYLMYTTLQCQASNSLYNSLLYAVGSAIILLAMRESSQWRSQLPTPEYDLLRPVRLCSDLRASSAPSS